MKKRNSRVEGLKIFAMFLVVLCHSLPLYLVNGITELPGYIDLNQSTIHFSRFILILFSYLGQVGNSIFIVSTVYFLQCSHKTDYQKVCKFVLNTFVISVIFLLVYMLIYKDIPKILILESLFPVSFHNYWFITCYIIYYCIHGALNLISSRMNRKEHFFAIIALFCMYFIVSFLLINKYYYTNLVGFICYHFIVGYIYKYKVNNTCGGGTDGVLHQPQYNAMFKRKAIIACALGAFGLVALLLATNIIGLRFGIQYMRRWESINNPFILIIGVSAFLVANSKYAFNQCINKISSLTLLVFVISSNVIVSRLTKPYFFEYIYEHIGYRFIVPICLIIAFLTTIISFVVAAAYKKAFDNVINKGSEKTVYTIKHVLNMVYLKLM